MSDFETISHLVKLRPTYEERDFVTRRLKAKADTPTPVIMETVASLLSFGHNHAWSQYFPPETLQSQAIFCPLPTQDYAPCSMIRRLVIRSKGIFLDPTTEDHHERGEGETYNEYQMVMKAIFSNWLDVPQRILMRSYTSREITHIGHLPMDERGTQIRRGTQYNECGCFIIINLILRIDYRSTKPTNAGCRSRAPGRRVNHAMTLP